VVRWESGRRGPSTGRTPVLTGGYPPAGSRTVTRVSSCGTQVTEMP